MSITDELRDYIKQFLSQWGWDKHKLTEIADRIDAKHESACAAAYGSGVMSVPIALDESAWVESPKDADGVPIRIGDVMENIVCPSVHREVTGVGVECFYGFDEGNGRYSQFGANCYRHHHTPTVEDVLREFADEMNQNLGMYAGEAIDADEWRDVDNKTIAKFAARLRLADDWKEQ
jgi:hypothetical protein